MSGWPAADEARELRRRAEGAAECLRLALGRRAWRGPAGHWLGTGAGSSIEFHDHRPFLPGDDPRYLDWAAYARSGQLLAKMFREDVSPRVDLVLDASPSMLFDAAKRARTLELFYFVVESVRAARAALACHVLAGDSVVAPSLDGLLAGAWETSLGAPRGTAAPPLAKVPWRPGSLRVWISDLLFPGDPVPLLAALTARRGHALVLAPYCRAEAEPDWSGNHDFRDCESGARRWLRIDGERLRRYRDAYARHFTLWQTAGVRQAVLCCRVDSAGTLEAALGREALRAGAVEPWS